MINNVSKIVCRLLFVNQISRFDSEKRALKFFGGQKRMNLR